MEGLFEILIPLVIAAVYFCGNFLSSKSDDEGTPGSRPKRGESGETGEAQERQRKIQEDIRRKIEERRRAASGSDSGETAPDGVPQPAQVDSEPVESASPREPQREVVGRTREMRDRRAERRGRAEREEAPADVPGSVGPSVERTEIDDAFSWDRSDDAYDSDMERRLKQIEATKERAAKLREQAQTAKRKVGEVGGPSGTSGREGGLSGLQGPVRATLTNPSAVRAAFVYSEVLGRPKGFRNAESDVPGLARSG